jgi:hypothetical protein
MFQIITDVTQKKKNTCHSRTVLAGIQKNGCPTIPIDHINRDGHDNFILLSSFFTVHKISSHFRRGGLDTNNGMPDAAL